MKPRLDNADVLAKTIEVASGAAMPITFPPGTQFREFHGIPISADPSLNVIAWDVPGGRRFPYVVFTPDCGFISPAKFRTLVNSFIGKAPVQMMMSIG